METNKIVLLYNEEAFAYDGENESSIKFKESKKFFIASVIPFKDLIALTFRLPKDTSEDELRAQVEMEMYNEGGLDPNKEYVIDYVKYDSDEEYIIEGFALSKDKFDKEFNFFNKKIEAIDLLFPEFLSYQVLYNKGLEKDKNDLFIVIDENSSFSTMYKNGEYIGHRGIDSLSTISKKVGIEVEKLKEYLLTKGLKRENYSLEETDIFDSLQDVFIKIVEKLIYFTNSKRGTFGVDGVDRIIIDFYGKTIEGLEEFFINYGYEHIEIQTLKCCTEDIEKVKLYIFLEYAYEVANNVENIQKVNLSFWERKKPIYKYKTLIYFAVLIIFVLISFVVYGYFVINANLLDKKIAKKRQIIKKNKELTSKYQEELKKLKKENEKLVKEIEKLNKKKFTYETTLKMVPFLQKQKINREKFINDVVFVLAKYKLNVQYIKEKDIKNMQVLVISKTNQRDRIAKFIKDILEKGYSQANTDKIFYENGIYKSNIRIER